MSIKIPYRQGRQLLEITNLAITLMDKSLNRASMEDEDLGGDEFRDLIDEREQASRFHDVILAKIGNSVEPFWSCRDADCAWWNLKESKECENCGEQAPHL